MRALTDKPEQATARGGSTRAEAPTSAPAPRPLEAVRRQLGDRRTRQLVEELQNGQRRVSHRGEPSEQEADRVAELLADHVGYAGAAGTPGSPAGSDDGQPLPDHLRRPWEQRLGQSLSTVRVHAGPDAEHLSAVVRARAVTTGQDIFFAKGAYHPELPAGQRLLAHEVAHAVVHQADRATLHRKEADAPATQEKPANADDPSTILRLSELALHGLQAEVRGSVAQQLAAQRAVALYVEVYEKNLKRALEAQQVGGFSPLFDAERRLVPPRRFIDEAVAQAKRKGADEDATADELDPTHGPLVTQKYAHLFHRLLAAQNKQQAEKYRQLYQQGRDAQEKLKWSAAENHDVFLDAAITEYRPFFLAQLYDENTTALETSATAQGAPELNALNPLAEQRARDAGEKEFRDGSYRQAKLNPEAVRQRTVDDPSAVQGPGRARLPWMKDLQDAKGPDLGPGGGADLLQAEMGARHLRLTVRNGFPQELLAAYLQAEAALIARLAERRPGGNLLDHTGSGTVEIVRAFYERFYAYVGALPADQAKALKGTQFPSRQEAMAQLDGVVANLEWPSVKKTFNAVLTAMDSLVGERLDPNQHAQLEQSGGLARSLEQLSTDQPDMKKVAVLLYPEEKDEPAAQARLRNTGRPGSPDIVSAGTPFQFYLYKDQAASRWVLEDFSHQRRVSRNVSEGGDYLRALITELDGMLNFPKGKLFWQVSGAVGSMETNGQERLSVWLSRVGLYTAAAGLTVGGAAVAAESGGLAAPASVVMLEQASALLLLAGGVTTAAGAGADLLEKARYEELTKKDVVVDALTIATSLLPLGGATLRTIATSERFAGTALGNLAGRAVYPLMGVTIAADASLLAVMTPDFVDSFRAIRGQPDGSEKKLAMARLVAVALVQGGLTLLGIRENTRQLLARGRLPLSGAEGHASGEPAGTRRGSAARERSAADDTGTPHSETDTQRGEPDNAGRSGKRGDTHLTTEEAAARKMLSDAEAAEELARMQKITDPEKLAAALKKDEAYRTRMADNEKLIADEAQLRRSLETAKISEERFKVMLEGDPARGGERRPLAFATWEQYDQFKAEFAELMSQVRVNGKPVSAEAKTIGTATGFYSGNPDKMLGHHFDRLAPKEMGDIDIDLMSPELVKHMLDRPTALNDKVIMGGKMVLFRNELAKPAVGVYDAFPQFDKFSARWEGILGREVNIKLKADLTPISEVPKPERGPIEFFRQETLQ